MKIKLRGRAVEQRLLAERQAALVGNMSRGRRERGIRERRIVRRVTGLHHNPGLAILALERQLLYGYFGGKGPVSLHRLTDEQLAEIENWLEGEGS